MPSTEDASLNTLVTPPYIISARQHTSHQAIFVRESVLCKCSWLNDIPVTIPKKKISEGYNVLPLSSSCCDLYNYQSFSIPTPVVKLLSWQDTVTASTHSSQLLPVQKAAADFHRPQLLESRTMGFQMCCSQTIGVCSMLPSSKDADHWTILQRNTCASFKSSLK